MGDALHTHGGVTSAQEARVADAGLLALQGPGAFDVRVGVLHGPGSTNLVSGTTTTAPNWTYQIAPHNWVSSRGAANGPYRGALEATTTVSTALPPASNSRIDVIWVKQGDATPGVPSPDATTAPVYGVTSGAAAASPTKPAIPVGAVELATATVPSTATGGTAGTGVVITQTALQTVARGAAIPVRSQAERDALTPFEGLRVFRLDTGADEVYRSGAWRSPLAEGVRANLPLSGGWGVYGGGYYTPSYLKEPNGKVTTRGMVAKIGGDVPLGIGGEGLEFCKLPAEIRPVGFMTQMTFAGLGNAADTWPVRLYYRSSDNTLRVIGMSGGSGTFYHDVGYIALDGVTWDTHA